MLTFKKRLLRLVRLGLLLSFLGMLYAWIADRFGGIPCVFHQLTGLMCPGCGVTRMFLSLLHGEIREAFSYNAAVFCLLPVGGLWLCDRCIRYVKLGKTPLRPWENVLAWTMVVFLLVFGCIRNLAVLC